MAQLHLVVRLETNDSATLVALIAVVLQTMQKIKLIKSIV